MIVEWLANLTFLQEAWDQFADDVIVSLIDWHPITRPWPWTVTGVFPFVAFRCTDPLFQTPSHFSSRHQVKNYFSLPSNHPSFLLFPYHCVFHNLALSPSPWFLATPSFSRSFLAAFIFFFHVQFSRSTLSSASNLSQALQRLFCEINKCLLLLHLSPSPSLGINKKEITCFKADKHN